MRFEYKVIDVTDGTLSSVLAGGKGIYLPLVEACINALAAEGWRLISAPALHGGTSMFITMERAVPEAEQDARAARCIDDVVAAEDAAIQILIANEKIAASDKRATRMRRATGAGLIGAAIGFGLADGETSDV